MTVTIRRRELLAALGSAAVSWPRAARAQHDRVRRIGVLMSIAESDPEAQPRVAVVGQGLQQRGWTDGRNVRIDYHWGAGDVEHMRAQAIELVRQAPDVILATTTALVVALLEQTSTIPIVFVGVTDPVGQGFVDSLARPGGNVTGFTIFEFSIGGKWIQALKEIAPQLAQVAVLYNPKTSPYELYLRSIESAANALSVQSIATPVYDVAGIEGRLGELRRKPNRGLIVLSDIFTVVHRDIIIALAAQHRFPAIYPFRYFCSGGGLICYGVDVLDTYRRAVLYIDRILKGTKPGDLPVQQPTKYELVINLKTAKALGLEIPQTLLARADEVIE